MASFVDFAAIKAAVSFADAASKLGLELKPSGNQLRGACPCSGDDRSLVITEGKGYYCFSEKKGGDVIGLAAHVLGVSVKDAAMFLGDGKVATSNPTVTVPTPQPEKPLTRGFDRAKYQDGLDRNHELLKDIPQDFIERADIGVSSRGALKGIVLPTYDKTTGEFICYVKVEGIELPKATVTHLKRAS